ncbi:MAG: hypothetical protein H0W88_01570 [Parachlamydiaceae bacterium]|nr:hypothetical protein [Parachlamydiaceae bacterium]
MVQLIFKQINKCLLTAILTIIPFMINASEIEDLSSNKWKEDLEFKGKFKFKKPSDKFFSVLFQIAPPLTVALTNLHDYSVDILLMYPIEFAEDSANQIILSIAPIAEFLFPINPTKKNNFEVLLNQYFSTGEAYVNALSVNAKVDQLLLHWLELGSQVANVFHQYNPKVLKKKEMQNIMRQFTLLEAGVANNLHPTATSFTDITEAEELNAQANILFTNLGILLTVAKIDKNKHRCSDEFSSSSR